MNNKKGFTLTEILLAVMIVGVIGIALAALTTAAVREGGVGRSKAVLRGQLSLALRQLRQDILESSSIISADGGNLKLERKYQVGPDQLNTDVTYSFTAGHTSGGGGGFIGGTIKRNNEVWLENVKSISDSDSGFVSPSFTLEESPADGTGGIESRLRVRIIVEIASDPIVNDVVDETFVLPHGFAIQQVSSGD